MGEVRVVGRISLVAFTTASGAENARGACRNTVGWANDLPRRSSVGGVSGVLCVDEQGAVLLNFLLVQRPDRDHAQLRQGG